MKIIRNISIICILLIVVFINLNEDTRLWDLVFNMQYYLIVSVFIFLGWTITRDLLTRSLLIALGFYYSFELVMDILNIFNSELYDDLYRTKTINYILALSCGCSLFMLYIIVSFKKILAKVLSSIKKLKKWIS